MAVECLQGQKTVGCVEACLPIRSQREWWFHGRRTVGGKESNCFSRSAWVDFLHESCGLSDCSQKEHIVVRNELSGVLWFA